MHWVVQRPEISRSKSPEAWSWRGQAMAAMRSAWDKGTQKRQPWETASGMGRERCGQREGKPQLRRRISLFLSDLALGRSPI